MRKVIVIFLSLLFVVAMLAGCQPSAPAETQAPASEEPAKTEAPAAPAQPEEPTEPEGKTAEGMKIAYFVSTMANEFHQARANAAIKYAKDKYGAEVTIMDGKSDANVMTQNVDMLATSDFNGATLHIWEADAAKPGVEAAIAQGIAVTSFFSPLGDTGIPTYRSDEAGGSKQMGADAAKKWIEAHPDKPIVTIQLGWPDNREVKTGRTDPFVEGIRSVVGDNFTDLGCLDCSAGADATKEALANALVTNPDINIIYSEAGDLTPGAMAALIDKGRGKMDNGKPLTEIVCSVDCPLSEIRDIFNPNSSLKASLGLPPIGTSEAIIDLIVKVYLGEIPQVSQPAQEFFGPVQVVDAWNMTLDEVIKWYNEQFGTSYTEADIMG